MDWPSALLIEADEPGAFLYRFTSNGALVGDTWHMTVAEAQEQTTYEYGELLSEWKPVPPDIQDPVAFAIRCDS
jgi:hypothetical protein